MYKDKTIRNRILAIIVSVSVVLAMVSSFALAEDFIGGGEDAEVTTTQPEEIPEVGSEETELEEKTKEKGTAPNSEKEVKTKTKTARAGELTPTPEEAFSVHTNAALGNYIYRYDVTKGGKDVVIPATIDGKKINSITGTAFTGIDLDSVYIPDGITKIDGGTGAFKGCGISTLRLPSTLQSIGAYAFYGNAITSLDLPEGLETIGSNAFGSNSFLTSVTIPGTVNSIDVAAFNSCGLTQLEFGLPSNLTAIANNAFGTNSGLTEIVLPEGLTEIGNDAFVNCSRLAKVTLPDSLVKIGNNAFRSNGISQLNFGSGLQEIGVGAFAFNTLLNTLSLPNSLKTIGQEAFSNCQIGENLVIPDSVTSLGISAFQNNKIPSVEIGSGVSVIPELCFLGNQIKEIQIPANVTQIDNQAFHNNQIFFVDLPDTVTTLHETAFGMQKITTGLTRAVGKTFPVRRMSAVYDSARTEQIRNITSSWGSYNTSTKEVELNRNLTKNYTIVKYQYRVENNAIQSDTALDIQLIFDGATYDYEVQFQNTDGSIIESKYAPAGGTVVPPANPTPPSGSVFTGWDKKFDNVTSAMIVKPVFVSGYNITYKDGADAFASWKTGYTVPTGYPINQGITLPTAANIEKTGYNFVGWYDNQELEGSPITEIPSTATGDKTFYAKFEKQKFTVEFVDWNGTQLKTDTVDYGTGATPPANPTREGYIFKEWDKTFNSVTSNLTVKATYTQIFNIIYKDGNAVFTSWKSSYTAPATYKEGDTVTLPANGNIEKAGYEFDGWYGNATFEGNLATGITATDKGDKTFYAKFTQIHTVKFVDWDTGELKTEQVRHGGAATAPNNPAREGYEFKGWDKTFDSVTSNLTVKATYAEIFDIAYKDGNAAFNSWKSSYTAPATYKEGDTVTLPVEGNIEKAGYEFDGWYDNATFKGNLVTGITATDKGDKTFYAKFTQIHKVQFVDWDNGELKTEQVRHGGAATAPNNPAREGYVFKGWDKAFDSVTSNLTVKATYAEIFDIEYKDGNAAFTSWKSSYTAPSTYEEGTKVTLPVKSHIAKTGFAFLGWYDNAQFTGSPVTEINAAATGDKTFYARFVAAHTVTFTDYNGDVLKTEAVIDGEDATAPADPNRDGYVFKGWDKSFTSVTSDLTVTATYAKLYDIVYKDGVNPFDSWKADFTAPITYEENTAVALPVADNITKDKYIFDGWYKNEGLTGDPVTKIDNTVNADVTLYAKWKQLVFEDNSGKIEFEEGQDNRWQFKIEQKKVDIANNIANIKAVYDIYFTLNNQRVEVKDKKMTITLNLETKDQGFQNYKVVYMDNNGAEKERYNPTLINNGKSLQFEANHLSYYGIVAWNNAVNPGPPVNPDVPNIPDNPDTPDTPDTPDNPDTPDTPDKPNRPDEPNQKADTPEDPADPENPQTGDENELAGLIGLLGISIAGLVIVIKVLNRRQKRTVNE